MKADWPGRAVEHRDEAVVAIFGMRRRLVGREPREALDRAAVDQRRIVDLEPGRQPVDDQEPRVARLGFRHLERHHDALVLREALQVELLAVERIERPLDRVAVGRRGLGRDRRAGDGGDEFGRRLPGVGDGRRLARERVGAEAAVQRALDRLAVDGELAEAAVLGERLGGEHHPAVLLRARSRCARRARRRARSAGLAIASAGRSPAAGLASATSASTAAASRSFEP